jgi:CrcB protein
VGAKVIAAVLAGGCAGGLARYEVLLAWPADAHAFPWAVFVINCSGALALAVLMVRLPEGWPRRLLGTGFLGAWTTFSAIAGTADQLIAHGHALLGAGYVVASAFGGLLSALAGATLARRSRRC